MIIENVGQIQKNVIYRLECDGSLLIDTDLDVVYGTKISDPLFKNLLIGSDVTEIASVRFIVDFLDGLTALTKRYGIILEPSGDGDCEIIGDNPNDTCINYLSDITWDNGRYCAIIDLQAVVGK